MDEPRIITADEIGLEFNDVFGNLGAAYHVTGHFSAGARAGDWRQAIALARRFHLEHIDHGWGGCGYHFLIADDGTLVCLRPVRFEGAHVGGHNGHNIGVLCAGESGHRPTRAQRETYAWLLTNAHTPALPHPHRTREDLRDAELMVHHMWHGHTTNPCAGWFEGMFLAGTDQPAAGESTDPPDSDRPLASGYPPATDFRGLVADSRHVTLIDAHRATSRSPIGRPGGAGVQGQSPRRSGRLALAFE
jgi:N-acetylmuramoyl-L-alanine amidase